MSEYRPHGLAGLARPGGAAVNKTPGENVPPAKPPRDWWQLLIVPLALAVLTLAWGVAHWMIDNRRQDRRIAADRSIADTARKVDRAIARKAREADQAIAKESREDATLNDYFKQMSTFMLENGLLTSK